MLAWDEVAQAVVTKRVTRVLPHQDDEIAILEIDGLTITTTADHPFLSTDAGWVDAGDLWRGARVKTARGTAVVGGVAIAPYDGVLWDLTVDEVHTFFVGPHEAAVHNCPNVNRLPTPPTPGGINNPAFGKVMNWGQGDAAARAQIANLDRAALEQAA